MVRKEFFGTYFMFVCKFLEFYVYFCIVLLCTPSADGMGNAILLAADGMFPL